MWLHEIQFNLQLEIRFGYGTEFLWGCKPNSVELQFWSCDLISVRLRLNSVEIQFWSCSRISMLVRAQFLTIKNEKLHMTRNINMSERMELAPSQNVLTSNRSRSHFGLGKAESGSTKLENLSSEPT